MEDGANKVVVVDRVQDDLNVSLQQSGFHIVSGFFGVLDLDRGVRLAVLVQFETITLQQNNT